MIIEIKPAADVNLADADCFVVPVTADGGMSPEHLTWLLDHSVSAIIGSHRLRGIAHQKPGWISFSTLDNSTTICALAITQPDRDTPSRLEWIEEAIDRVIAHARTEGAVSIATHALGCGSTGGLPWDAVRSLFERKFQASDMDAVLYEPVDYIRISSPSGPEGTSP